MLEFAAGSATDGIYKAPTTKKRAMSYYAALERATTMINTDLSWSDFSQNGESSLHQHTAEEMVFTSDDSMDICVTSPPYLNNFDFAEMTRMELYFWGYASSWAEITSKVRAAQIVNTCTAPTPLKNDRARWLAALSDSFQPKANTLSDKLLLAKKDKGGSKDYFKLVHPYFAQMSAVIQEVWRTLKPESSFHLVVADAALYGVHIHTQTLLADLMTEAGFSVKSIERLRSRGDRWVLAKRQGPSGTLLGEFHIHAVKNVLAT